MVFLITKSWSDLCEALFSAMFMATMLDFEISLGMWMSLPKTSSSMFSSNCVFDNFYWCRFVWVTVSSLFSRVSFRQYHLPWWFGRCLYCLVDNFTSKHFQIWDPGIPVLESLISMKVMIVIVNLNVRRKRIYWAIRISIWKKEMITQHQSKSDENIAKFCPRVPPNLEGRKAKEKLTIFGEDGAFIYPALMLIDDVIHLTSISAKVLHRSKSISSILMIGAVSLKEAFDKHKDVRSQNDKNMKSTLLLRMRIPTHWYRINISKHVTDAMVFTDTIWKAKEAMPIWHTHRIKVRQIGKKKDNSIQWLLFACKAYLARRKQRSNFFLIFVFSVWHISLIICNNLYFDVL